MAQAKSAVRWRSKPEAHDYPAASDYLSLLVADPALRAELVEQLRAAPVVHYKAKDLLRASQLPLLAATNVHVALDLKKIRKRVPLSPVLLVRGDLVRGFPLQVADGYHRVCASHLVDENTDIPCRLIDLPKTTVRTRTVRPSAAVAAAEPASVAVSLPEQSAPGLAEKAAPARKVAAQKVVAAEPVTKSVVRKAAGRRTAAKVAPAGD